MSRSLQNFVNDNTTHLCGSKVGLARRQLSQLLLQDWRRRWPRLKPRNYERVHHSTDQPSSDVQKCLHMSNFRGESLIRIPRDDIFDFITGKKSLFKSQRIVFLALGHRTLMLSVFLHPQLDQWLRTAIETRGKKKKLKKRETYKSWSDRERQQPFLRVIPKSYRVVTDYYSKILGPRLKYERQKRKEINFTKQIQTEICRSSRLPTRSLRVDDQLFSLTRALYYFWPAT